jgi:hypothetical protein
MPSERAAAEFIEFFRLLFRREGRDETIRLRDETIFCFGADVRKQPTVIT